MKPIRASQSLPIYRSYLLRLWRVDNAGQPVCRASLEVPGSQTQLQFDSLAALYRYLAIQLGIGDDKASKGESIAGGQSSAHE